MTRAERATHLYFLKHSVRNDHPSLSSSPRPFDDSALLCILHLVHVGLHIRRIEDEHVDLAREPREQGGGEIREDGLEGRGVGVSSELGRSGSEGVKVGTEVYCGRRAMRGSPRTACEGLTRGRGSANASEEGRDAA